MKRNLNAAVSVFCLFLSVACAADKVWQSAGDGIWSDDANWTGGVPGNSDTAIFNNAISSDVIVDMDLPDQAITKLHLQNATAPWRRIFNG
ncbi:MAG: hypothetical protein PHU80_11870, partial [Kiritimatiellae bacterium]|nr:hypothetical protein [Kiritimatiellia bacterium]